MERRQQYPPEFITKHGQQILFDKTIIPLVMNIDLDTEADVTIVDPPNMIKVVSANGTTGSLSITCTEPNVIHIVKDESAAAFKLVVNDAVTGVELADIPAGVSHATVYSVPTVVPTAPQRTMGDLAYDEVMKQGVLTKTAALSDGSDAASEKLENKHLVLPLINDSSAVRATFEVGLEGTADVLTISVLTPGYAGDALFCMVDVSPSASSIAVIYESGTLAISVPDGTTAYELVREICRYYASLLSTFMFSYPDGADDSVIETTTNANFSGGSDGHIVTSTGEEIDATVDMAPTSGAPQTTQVAAAATYDTDKITFTAEVGEDGNDISVEATCQLSATLGAGTTEITLVGAKGLYNGGDIHLVSAQIVQGVGVEVKLGLVNTAGVIVITLPTDDDEDAVDVTMDQLISLLESERNSGGELEESIEEIVIGTSYDGSATAGTTTAIPFTADTNTVVDYRNTVTIYLAYDGTNFDDWDEVVTAIAEESTLVTASAGAEIEAGPFAAINLEGGLDITAGVSGAIRYEATKIWISVEESTATESNWKSADLTDPNA